MPQAASICNVNINKHDLNAAFSSSLENLSKWKNGAPRPGIPGLAPAGVPVFPKR